LIPTLKLIRWSGLESEVRQQLLCRPVSRQPGLKESVSKIIRRVRSGGDTVLRELTKQFDKPVFVFGYPTQVKAFYMEPWPGRPEVCKSVDLLAPEGYGEITGGSERMSDPDELVAAIHRHDLPLEQYKWYIDLRHYGSVPHSGFGLGLERTVAWICGIDHIRQTTPFPRSLNRMRP